jgi:hypothetical protein
LLEYEVVAPSGCGIISSNNVQVATEFSGNAYCGEILPTLTSTTISSFIPCSGVFLTVDPYINPLCANSNSVLTASATNLNSGTINWEWYDISTPGLPTLLKSTANSLSDTYTFTGGSSGTILVRVSDGQGCEDEEILPITVNPIPTPDVGPDQTLCSTEPAFNLIPNVGTWTLNGNPISTFTPANHIGINTLVYSETIAGCTGTDSKVITVIQTPLVDAGIDQTVCINAAPFVLTGFSPLTASWSGTGLVPTNTFDPALAGLGTHVLTLSQTAGTCTGADTKTITVVPLPVVNFTVPAEYCFGTNLQLVGSPAGGVFSGTDVSTSGLFVATTSGTRTIRYTYTDPTTGCSNWIEREIEPSDCCPYMLAPVSVYCGTNDVHCVQLRAIRPVSDGIKGMDFVIRYNNKQLIPIINASGFGGSVIDATYGEVILTNGVNSSMVEHASNILPANFTAPAPANPSDYSDLHVSIYYNSAAPVTADWNGIGDVICLKFRINGTAIGALDDVKIGVLQNSNVPTFGFTDEEHTISTNTQCVENGGVASVTVIQNPILRGMIRFHNTSSVLKYDFANPAAFNITSIGTSDGSCQKLTPGISTTPNLSGLFSIDMTGASFLNFSRDINGDYYSPSCTGPSADVLSVMNSFNGYDTYLMELITTMKDPSTLNNTNLRPNRGVPDAFGTSYTRAQRQAVFPSPYQMIAADVNMNGRVRANDLTWLQQRIVSSICEFPQAWNYNEGVNPAVPNAVGLKSYDWRFTNRSGSRSSNYPYVGAVSDFNFTGYWRDMVPQTQDCIEFVKSNGCYAYPTQQDVFAVLLGDLDGSWRNLSSFSNVRTVASTQVVVDYGNGTKLNASTYRFPITFDSEDTVVSLDLALNYDESKIKVVAVGALQEGIAKNARMVFNDFNASQLLLTSHTMETYRAGAPIFYVDVISLDGLMKPEYLGQGAGFLNGQKVGLTVEGTLITDSKESENSMTLFEIIPNPSVGNASIKYNVSVANSCSIRILNNLGQLVKEYQGLDSEGLIEVNSLDLANGMYQVILTNGNLQKTQKMVISK